MSLAKTLIKESVHNLKLDNYKAREKYINRLVDYYNGNNKTYIKDRFKIEAFREVPCYESNITKRFINKMARIYRVGAVRNVNNTYRNLTSYKNMKFKHTEKMTNLVGSVAVQVMIKEDELRGQYFDYNNVYNFHAFFSEIDPFTPIAITYPITNPTEDVSLSENLKWAYWDDQRFIIHDYYGKIVLEDENPYGILPFFFTHRENQTDSFYVSGANDIMNCNEQANILLTELQLGLRLHMFGQYWISGINEDGTITRVGSDVIIDVPEDGRFGIENPSANISETLDALKLQIELCAKNNHLDITWAELKDRPPSGVSLMIRDLERHEDYLDDIDLWKIYEEECYKVERVIAKANGIDLPNNFSVDFNEPIYPLSAQEQIMKDDWELEHGLISEVDILMRKNPDLTESKAEKIIKNNKGEQDVKAPTIFEQARQRAEGTQGEGE